MNLHLLQLEHVNAVMRQNHLDAYVDDQLRTLRADRPHRMAGIAIKTRALIGRKLVALGDRIGPHDMTQPGGVTSSGIGSPGA